MSRSLGLLLWLTIVAVLAVQALSPASLAVQALSDWYWAPDLALSERLWRQGLDWRTLTAEEQQRQRSLASQAEELDQKIRSERSRSLDVSLSESRVQEEIVLFQKMLAYDEGRFEAAMKSHLMSEQDFAASIREQLLDHAWLEASLNPETTNEADAKAWFQARQEALQMPERFHASHIFLSAHEPGKPDRENEARLLAQRLAAGDWRRHCADFSEDERTRHFGGDLGWFSAQRMPADFMASVQALKPGQRGQVIRTRLGWHVVNLMEKQPARAPSFDEMQREIFTLLTNQGRRKALEELLAR